MVKNTKKPLLNFPCDFAIKVMGLANDDFEIHALHIIHQHFPKLKETALATRHSKNKKYLSLTVTVTASSQQQLDAVYTELSANPHILMTL